MSTSTTKAQLIERLRQERAAWDGLLARLDEQRMTASGAMGEWTFKDLIAHITAWRQHELNGLVAAHEGRAAPPAPWAEDLGHDGDTDAINKWIYQRNKHRPLGDILAESRRSLDALEHLVQVFGEDELGDSDRLRWLEGEITLKHFHEEHEPAIRAWLARPAG